MGAAGREAVRELSWEAMVDRYVALYRRIAAHAAPQLAETAAGG
jgi:glycosyltransferase involved in cell wall biosynthesis